MKHNSWRALKFSLPMTHEKKEEKWTQFCISIPQGSMNWSQMFLPVCYKHFGIWKSESGAKVTSPACHLQLAPRGPTSLEPLLTSKAPSWETAMHSPQVSKNCSNMKLSLGRKKGWLTQTDQSPIFTTALLTVTWWSDWCLNNDYCF